MAAKIPGVSTMLALVPGLLAVAAARPLGVALAARPPQLQAQAEAVRGLLRRRLPAHADAFELRVVAPPSGSPQAQAFSIAPGAQPGKVALAGTSGVALASALSHYLKYDAGVQIDVWFTAQTAVLPPAGQPLPAPTPANITSPYIFQNYLNICAFGYSTAWYSWARWQGEVDWMALNGVVNPLAMVGQDAIWLDTFADDFGLPKPQLLGEFFAGPTFQPWHWMGNLNGWGGPVDEAFLRGQLALNQNITAAMSAFGMRPVLPAFAGHVPRSLKDKYPQANITQLEPWHGHMPEGTYFLSPTSELFEEIGKKFVARQVG